MSLAVGGEAAILMSHWGLGQEAYLSFLREASLVRSGLAREVLEAGRSVKLVMYSILGALSRDFDLDLDLDRYLQYFQSWP